MKQSVTLNRYLAKSFFMNMLFVLMVLFAIIYLFDTVELLRRAGKKEGVPLGLVLQMGFLKLPEVGQMLLPFAILFSGMFTFWQLTRRYELVVVRAAGFSVWQFLAPVLGVALLCGIVNVTLINPLGSMLLGKFEALESRYLTEKKNYIALLEEGLWLRQIEDDDRGQVILHANRINLESWTLQDVMVLFFGENDSFLRRLDAKKAKLADGMWSFEGVVSNRAGERSAELLPLVALPTDLTARELEESFSSPETLSFWQLPRFIKTLEVTGFDSTRLRIHFQGLLAQPFLFAAMVLLAASVSLRQPRERGTMALVMIGVMMGFIIFFMGSFLQALGATQQIPVFLAAWSPALISLMMGLAVMLTLEDG